jgi:2-keto-4-pentenoate hydratase/2-oxohepta-3-ene-1,7-dioic acid hydratase in catechol pathway
MVTADELTDPQSIRLACSLNGTIMQDGHTSDMNALWRTLPVSSPQC